MLRIIEENGPVEMMQIAAWVAAGLLAIWALFRGRTGRERLFAAWLALLCTLAFLRENDAHLWVNPRVIGEWGVHFRTRWWLSAEAPVLPRLLWLVVGIGAIAAVIMPIIKVSPRTLLLLRGRDGAWLILMLGMIALFGGYAFDDLLGRDQFVPKIYTKVAEEGLELVGAVLVAAAIALHGRITLTAREARAAARLAMR
jgi:hypothetical protein